MDVKEGYMVKYKDCIWAVKGCFHPPDYIIAIPRYYKGIKLKRKEDSLSFVKVKFPHLVKYIPEIGIHVPLLPIKDCEILNPYEANINNNKIIDFINLLGGKIGVTGSYLYLGTGRDIDLFSEDENHYYRLLDLRKRGITEPLEDINDDEIETLDRKSYRFLKINRILEGKYMGIPYTFKIVKCFEIGKVIKKFQFQSIVKIINPIKSYTLPTLYFTDLGFYLTSFRIRFTELKKGTELYINGELFEREEIYEIPLDHSKIVYILKN
jgi:hypothetical protein